MGKRKKSSLSLNITKNAKRKKKIMVFVRNIERDMINHIMKSAFAPDHVFNRPITPRFARKSVKRTSLKSPRQLTFTPTKSPHRKRFRKLDFSHTGELDADSCKTSDGLDLHATHDNQDGTQVNKNDSGLHNDTLGENEDEYGSSACSITVIPEETFNQENAKASPSGHRMISRTPEMSPTFRTCNTEYTSAEEEYFPTGALYTATPIVTPDNDTPRICWDRDVNSETLEMMELTPYVIESLSVLGKDNVFLKFFKQIHQGTQSINNIAFLLWSEVVEWYENDTSTTMRYSDETKKFWKLGWEVFGGKFLRFMTGYKNTTQITLGETIKGHFDPQQSEINFVVPSESVLRNYQPYGEEIDINEIRKPGIYTDVIKLIVSSFEGKSACLTFDGKKLKQGLTTESGDIDLLGFETGPSVKVRKAVIQNELEHFQEKVELFKRYENDEDTKVLPANVVKDTITSLKEIHTELSVKVRDARNVKDKKEYARKKFIERVGEDWRHGKYVYVISAITAFIYEIENFIFRVSELLEAICQVIVYLHNSEDTFATGCIINLDSHQRYIPLEEQPDSQETRKIKQRSQRWHDLRNKSKVTGSSMYRALGLDGLKKQREHYDKVMCGIPEPLPKPEVAQFMEYGTVNEPNATATLVGKVLPVLHPTYEFHEEGCVCHNEGDVPFMVVSPDGSLYETNESGNSKTVKAAVEFKCPVFRIHTEFPERYYLQCICEIKLCRRTTSCMYAGGLTLLSCSD